MQWSLRRGHEARDHQLPYPEAGARRPVTASAFSDPPRTGSATAASTSASATRARSATRCGVEVTRAKVRRERMGHIELAAPVSPHLVLQGHPQPHGPDAGHQPPHAGKGAVLRHLHRYRSRVHVPAWRRSSCSPSTSTSEMREKYEDDFERVGMGAEAIKKLLELRSTCEKLCAELRERARDTRSGQKRVAHAQAPGGRGGLPRVRQPAPSG